MSQATITLPMNVRGTAPGKMKWSYFGRQQIPPPYDKKRTHAGEGLGPDAVHEDVVDGVEVEALLDLRVWRKRNMAEASE